MKTKIFLWVLAMLVSTMLQGAILVWLYGACQTLFWASVALWAASIAVFIYFVRKVGLKEYFRDYWTILLD